MSYASYDEAVKCLKRHIRGNHDDLEFKIKEGERPLWVIAETKAEGK